MAKSTAAGAGLISGKVGGWVFYVVNGKQMIRELTPVYNPQTARQTEIRIINTELARAWRDDLNQGQRTAWIQRAKLQGTQGILLFIKQNFPLLDFGLAKVITPPPMVMPPELFDLIIFETSGQLLLHYDRLDPAIITAQTPFIDIEIAGGFTQAIHEIDGEIIKSEVTTEALSQGRKHQESDFKHAIYTADLPTGIEPDPNEIAGFIPDGTIRNVVFRVRRYNKFGNSSEVKLLNAIITAPPL